MLGKPGQPWRPRPMGTWFGFAVARQGFCLSGKQPEHATHTRSGTRRPAKAHRRREHELTTLRSYRTKSRRVSFPSDLYPSIHLVPSTSKSGASLRYPARTYLWDTIRGMWSTETVIARHEAGLSTTASERARRHGSGEPGRDGGAERHAAWWWRCWRSGGLSGDGGRDHGDEGGGGRGRERGEPARAVVGARPRRPAPPRRVPRRRPRPAPRRPLRLPRRRARPDVRADHGDGLDEEGAGGELPEGGGPRAGHVRAEAGAGHGGRGGGRPQGGHLPGRRGHARRPARPRQPRPRHGQEGIAGQRERLPLPPRVLPCSHRQAAQTAQVK